MLRLIFLYMVPLYIKAPYGRLGAKALLRLVSVIGSPPNIGNDKNFLIYFLYILKKLQLPLDQTFLPYTSTYNKHLYN